MQTYTQRLEELYRFNDERKVKAFLRKHEDLTPLLMDAADPIRRLFGEKTPVVLELFQDPDAGDDESELFALTKQTFR